MKRLLNAPASLPPPDPNVLFRNTPWLSGLEPHVVDTMWNRVEIVNIEHGEVMIRQQEKPLGIYIIIFGLVKVSCIQ